MTEKRTRVHYGVELLLPLAIMITSGCALRTAVSIAPLRIDPRDTVRAANRVEDLVNIGDYPRALALAPQIAAKVKPTLAEMKALGEAELAAGRFEDAKKHLRLALAQRPFRNDYANIAWSISQAEYLEGNYSAALEWAEVAKDYGLEIRAWHTDLLQALSGRKTYVSTGANEAAVRMESKAPSLPRIETRINEATVIGILDSGAVMTIVSDRLAAEAKLETLGDFRGMFLGLLGEPIEVRFAMIDRVTMGDLVIENVPVAVMAGEKMKFFTLNRAPFHIDLLLGAGLLREFRIELDFDGGLATFRYLEARERAPVADQNLFYLNSKPYVHGTLNGKGWYLYVLDTGSEISYLNSVEISRWHLQKSFAKVYRGAELQGLGGSTKRGIKVEDVAVGAGEWEGTFTDLPLYSSEKSGAVGLIGEDFLRHFRVILDFGTMRLELERPGEAQPER